MSLLLFLAGTFKPNFKLYPPGTVDLPLILPEMEFKLLLLLFFRNPTPSPYDNPQWEAFGTNSKIYPFGVVEAGQASANLTTYQSYEVSFWTTYLYSLEKLARGEEEALNPGGTYDPGRYYKGKLYDW